MSNSDAGLEHHKCEITLGVVRSIKPVHFRISDSRFNTIASGMGYLKVNVAPGIYEIEKRCGDTVSVQPIQLEEGQPYNDSDMKVPFNSSMPLPGTKNDNGARLRALHRLSSLEQKTLGDAGLVVFFNSINYGSSGRVISRFYDAFSIRNSRGDLISFKPNFDDESAGISMVLPAGGYTLEIREKETSYSQCIWLENNWTTGIFIPDVSDCHPNELSFDNASIQMTPLGRPWSAYEDGRINTYNQISELSLAALEKGESISTWPFVEQFLAEKYENPILGIVVALSLLQDINPDQLLVEKVVGRLTGHLKHHPDVQAIVFACHICFSKTKLSRPSPLKFPPYFQKSFDWILYADRKELNSIERGSIVEEVACKRVLRSPWTTWRQHSSTRTERITSIAYEVCDRFVSRSIRAARGLTPSDKKHLQALFLKSFDLVEPANQRLMIYFRNLPDDVKSLESSELLDRNVICHSTLLPLKVVTVFMAKFYGLISQVQESELGRPRVAIQGPSRRGLAL